MVINKRGEAAGVVRKIKTNATTILDKYLDRYRQLYLEEFFSVFGLMLLGLVVLGMTGFFNGLMPVLFILWLVGCLVPLVAFAKELPSRSLIRQIPKLAGLTYLSVLILFLVIIPFFLDYQALLATLLFIALSFIMTTELLVAIAENRSLKKVLLGEAQPFKSPRLKTMQAIKEGAYTRERVEREVCERLKAEQLRTELITNISHDIRTPLTSILNFSELLGAENLAPAARDYLGVVHKSAQRMKIMVDDLFTATKTAAGNFKLDIATVDFSEVLMQTYAPLHSMFREKDLELVYNRVDQTVPVLADGTHLSRVIQNLLSNAAKYSVNDTRVYIKVKAESDCTQIAVINVSKEMLDISPDQLMEQFVRGDQARHTDGSGLGLYIATNLLKAMAGELTLSIAGDVFTATLELPTGQNQIIGAAASSETPIR